MHICGECTCGCCRKFAIPITGYDILKISKNLKININSFIEIDPVPEERIEDESSIVGLFKFAESASDGFYKFCMKKVESSLVPGVFKCIFLQEWYNNPDNPSVENIVARCGIYGNRPTICAAFPATVDKSGYFAVIVSKKITEEDNILYKLCPREIVREDFPQNSESILRTVLMNKYEQDFFKTIAVIWNENPKPLNLFIPFLENWYAERVLIDNDTFKMEE